MTAEKRAENIQMISNLYARKFKNAKTQIR